MKKISRSVCLLLFIAALAAAQPTITGLSTANSSRRGLILIRGSGFGASQGSGRRSWKCNCSSHPMARLIAA
jgi:hypothetical protein